jgi:hypothetical protein
MTSKNSAVCNEVRVPTCDTLVELFDEVTRLQRTRSKRGVKLNLDHAFLEIRIERRLVQS